MAREASPRVVIVGSGNLAWHLAVKLRSLRFAVNLYNHRPNANLRKFSQKLGCTVHDSLNKIDPNALFYFLAVPDRKIKAVADYIKPLSPRAVLLHTSGATALKVLGRRGHGIGVFYPIQTFTAADVLDWNRVPIVIDGDSEETCSQIQKLALKFSPQVSRMDDATRNRLHLAAVLVNNFNNALFGAAVEIVDQAHAKDLLLPLLDQTVEKLHRLSSLEAQTGPAKRGDKDVMKRHLKSLAGDKLMRGIYKDLSRLIERQQSNRKESAMP